MKSFIKESIKRIRNARDNNRLVIVVGAGISINSGCPSWSNLVKNFADELGLKFDSNTATPEDFQKIPQIYLTREVIKNIMIKYIASFLQSHSFPRSHFIQLNFSTLGVVLR